MKKKNHRSLLKLFAATMFAVLSLCFFTEDTRAAGVTLTSAPTSQTINAGQRAMYTLKINRTSYADKVTLSATSLPPKGAASFNPNTTTASSSTLSVTTTTDTPAGTYNLKINGSANGITIDPIFITLVVKPAPDITLTATPDTHSALGGQYVTYTIDITRTNFDGPVSFTAEDLPPGVSGYFEPSTTYGNRVYFRALPSFNFQCNGMINIIATAQGLLASKNLKLYLVSNCGVNWTRQFGSTVKDSVQHFGFTNSKAVTDSAGNFYVVGNTQGLIDPNGNNGLIGGFDGWVSKFDKFGNQQWIQQIGSDKEDYATEVKADNAGNVYVAGYTNGILGTRFDHYDVWLAKFDSNGNRLWLRQTGSSLEEGRFGIELSFDGNGNIRLVYLRARAEFNGNRIVTTVFNPNGNQTSSNDFRLSVSGFINEIALANDGSVFVVGHDFFSNADAWVSKFSSGGIRAWTQLIQPSVDDERANRVTTDNSGNVFVSGCKSSTINGNDLVNCTGSATEDAWVAKFDSAGNTSATWQPKSISTNAKDTIIDLTTDANGNLYLTGTTDGSFERTGGNAGASDIFFSRIDANGTQQWLKQMGTAGNDSGTAIAFNAAGEIFVSGISDGALGGPSSGDLDVWVMSYSANPAFVPMITSIAPASARAGNTVTITGTNFSRPLLGSPVRFNGVAATVLSITTRPDSNVMDMTVVVPQGATTGRITITNFYFCPVAISQTDFTIIP